MQTQKNIRHNKWLTLVALTAIFLFNSCKKDLQQEKNQEPQQQKFEKPNAKQNPFSYANIKKARATLAAQNTNAKSTSSRESWTDDDKLYTYVKFNPNSVSGDILKQLEADSSIQILDFPFANGEMYNDEFALDESKASQLKDGSLYAVVN